MVVKCSGEEIQNSTLMNAQEWMPAIIPKYAAECVKPVQAVGERFQDMKSKQTEWKWCTAFAVIFTVELADVPENALHENKELKGKV